MTSKMIYIENNSNGWNTAVSIQVTSDGENAVEETSILWRLMERGNDVEIWQSNRGERAVNLSGILNPRLLNG